MTEPTELTGADVAEAKGLPADVADLLTGSREEMEAKADRLAALISPPPPRPTGSADGGPVGATYDKGRQIDRQELANMTAAEIVEARRSGRLDDVIGGRR